MRDDKLSTPAFEIGDVGVGVRRRIVMNLPGVDPTEPDSGGRSDLDKDAGELSTRWMGVGRDMTR